MNEPYILNRQLILDRLGGDEEIFAVMIDMYLQDLDSYANNLQNTFQAGDVTALHREAHTVKGLFATFADDQGTALALSVEKQAKTGNLEGLAAPIAVMQARLAEVGEVLKAELAKAA